MPLPSSWVDEIFARLTVRYGDSFIRQYGEAETRVIKADWADVLAGFSGGSIKHAIDNLGERPPNAVQFRHLALSRPMADPLVALERPYVRDPAEVRAKLDALRAKLCRT